MNECMKLYLFLLTVVYYLLLIFSLVRCYCNEPCI